MQTGCVRTLAHNKRGLKLELIAKLDRMIRMDAAQYRNKPFVLGWYAVIWRSTKRIHKHETRMKNQKISEGEYITDRLTTLEVQSIQFLEKSGREKSWDFTGVNP